MSKKYNWTCFTKRFVFLTAAILFLQYNFYFKNSLINIIKFRVVLYDNEGRFPGILNIYNRYSQNGGQITIFSEFSWKFWKYWFHENL